MNSNRFTIGLTAVVALVALRLGLGFHFLYEGVWKIKHADEFTAEPFLSQAKGPAATMFYAMLPDLDGRQRLQKDLEAVELKDGHWQVKDEALRNRWERIRVAFWRCCNADSSIDVKSKKVCEENVKSAEKYLAEEYPEIKAHFDALDRFQAERTSGAAYEQKRHWDEMMELRAEAKTWLSGLESREQGYVQSLQALVGQAPNDDKEDGKQADSKKTDGKKKKTDGKKKDNKKADSKRADSKKAEADGKKAAPKADAPSAETRHEEPPAAEQFMSEGWNPFRWGRMHQINFAVTYGLTAIGFCLLLGLFSRPAALGGACFMLFVVLTQPAWPGIYPPDPPVAGHALLVNKDFVEMLALLVIASMPVGRWGGLDFFLDHWLLCPLWKRLVCRCKKEEPKS